MYFYAVNTTLDKKLLSLTVILDRNVEATEIKAIIITK